MKPLLFSAAALAAACFLLPGARCLAASPQITGAEAVAEVAGDGEHVSRVVLSYDAPIDAASVTPDDYEVTGRTITRAYPVEGQDPASAAPKPVSMSYSSSHRSHSLTPPSMRTQRTGLSRSETPWDIWGQRSAVTEIRSRSPSWRHRWRR